MERGIILTILMFVAQKYGPQIYHKYNTTFRRDPSKVNIPIGPASPAAQRALLFLTISAVVALINSFPYFAPPEIFSLTQSRLQIPVDVLFTRLSSLSSPPGQLSEPQTSLRNHFVSSASRLLYFKYGPSVIADCKFCNSEKPETYMYYALTSILAPHLLNLFILLLSTSGVFGGLEARSFRRFAVYISISFITLELAMTISYNHELNASATRIVDVYPFFWRCRVYRSLGLAFISSITGYFIYLKSTNRAFFEPAPPYMMAEHAARQLESLKTQVLALGIIKNTVSRDSKLRAMYNDYWARDAEVMMQMMEDNEVRDSINRALDQRLNLQTLGTESSNWTDAVFQILGKTPVGPNS